MALALEDHAAAAGRSEPARSQVERLAVMAHELIQLACGLSIEALRNSVRQRV